MTHNHKRADAWREAQLGLFTGSIYGATHTLTGHPLDTVKSKMQIQKGFSQMSSMSVIRHIWQHEGGIGFFRGCIPPLWGSMVYRGIMMSSYEYGYTWLEKNCPEDSVVRQESLFIVRPMIPMAAIFAAMCRGLFESPIEYAKVMGQTGQTWQYRDIYRGCSLQIVRTTALLIPIFSTLDIFRRKTQLLDTFLGNFLVTAGASGMSYLVAWPLETMKNLAQAGSPHPGATTRERLAFLGGPLGVYRGVWPGTLAGALRNGSAMVAMVFAQGWATQLARRLEAS